jgi:CheY-like chemotaxis protein
MPVLVIDDEALNRQLISELLTEEGYIVDQVADGREALTYLRLAPVLPCVIIIDLMMPLMNGWDFLRVRQDNPLYAPIPAVVISAVHTFAAAKVLGAQECLLKPLDLDRLLAIVQRYCPSAPPARNSVAQREWRQHDDHPGIDTGGRG